MPCTCVTFSISNTCGNSVHSFKSLSTSHNKPERVPLPFAIPFCLPANDKSWQGNEYVSIYNHLSVSTIPKSLAVICVISLVDYLSSLDKTSPFVLTSANGNMMTDTAWKRLYESYMHDLNLQYGNFVTVPNKYAPTKAPMMINPFTPHELRHTFCTIMYEAGVDVLTAKEQMGHSDVKTTLSIYTHLSSLHKERDIQKLNEFLSSSSAEEKAESC